jgi:DNA-directed RNA polymerase subunit M/transcription elongation factor TFIIS
MAKFCISCDNLLVPDFVNEELIFKCVMCNETYPHDDVDTLRYERVKEGDVLIFEKILNNAGKDPVTIKAHVNCINADCSGKIVKQVRVGDDMKLFNVCIICQTQWLN